MTSPAPEPPARLLPAGDGGPRRCPVCRMKIVVPDGEGLLLVRNAILRVGRTGPATAKCPRCKAWLEVPLRYGE